MVVGQKNANRHPRSPILGLLPTLKAEEASPRKAGSSATAWSLGSSCGARHRLRAVRCLAHHVEAGLLSGDPPHQRAYLRVSIHKQDGHPHGVCPPLRRRRAHALRNSIRAIPETAIRAIPDEARSPAWPGGRAGGSVPPGCQAVGTAPLLCSGARGPWACCPRDARQRDLKRRALPGGRDDLEGPPQGLQALLDAEETETS